jgi:hypothetical protein
MNKLRFCLAVTVICFCAIAPAVADDTGDSRSTIRNAWSGFPQGAWVSFDWSERWGQNPETIEHRRTILSGHRGLGTSLTETQRQQNGSWKRIMGGLHGAYPPDGEGMALVSESPDSIDVAGVPTSCVRREYVHDASDGSGQRLVLWQCPDIELVRRVLPQWSVSFGWQLGADVGRARIERRDAKGTVTSVELELEEMDDRLEIDGRSIACFREVLRWRHTMSGQQGRVTTETTRWLSAEVPGLVAKRVNDNKMGKIETFQVRSFGMKID